jgi:hypothetical protein
MAAPGRKRQAAEAEVNDDLSIAGPPPVYRDELDDLFTNLLKKLLRHDP